MHTMRIERHRDRREMAKQAGFRSVSWVSVLAGTLAAYGLTAALLAIAGGIAAGINGSRNFSGASTRDLKVSAGIIIAVALFLSFLFGGYVAGRMARRRGMLNGLVVFVLGVILAVGIAVWAKEAGAGPSLSRALRHTGAPTTWHAWRTVGIIAGAAALVAMLVGTMIGGIDGERWHTKLVRRALDPSVGPDAVVGTAAPVEREVAAPVAEPAVAEEPVIKEDSEGRGAWRHLLHH
jgi:ABC-type Fe3+ transport system permease subunit